MCLRWWNMLLLWIDPQVQAQLEIVCRSFIKSDDYKFSSELQVENQFRLVEWLV